MKASKMLHLRMAVGTYDKSISEVNSTDYYYCNYKCQDYGDTITKICGGSLHKLRLKNMWLMTDFIEHSCSL